MVSLQVNGRILFIIAALGFLAVSVHAAPCAACTAGGFQGFSVPNPSGTAWCTRMDSSVPLPGPEPDQTGLTCCCGVCPAGSYGSGVGACTSCEVGKSQAAPEKTSCTPCDKGYFADSRGSITCQQCPQGTFSNSPGATSCTVCKANSSPNARRDACVCDAGYYLTSSNTCAACPEGADCSGQGNTYKSLVALPGYFIVNNEIIACPISQSCKGNNLCSEGYQGFLCHSCSGFYGWSEIDLKQECKYCDTGRFAIITAVTAGSLVIALGVAIWVAITYSARPKLWFIVPLTIFLSMAQVNFLVATKPSQYSDWFSDYFLLYCRYVSSIRPTILELHCLFNDTVPHSIWIQGMYMLFLPPIIAFIGALLAKVWLKRHPVQYTLNGVLFPTPGFGTIFATSCSCVWFILYPDALWQALMQWDCTRIGGRKVLTYDSAINCTSSSYYSASYLLGVPLLLVMPLMHVLTAFAKKSLRQAAILLSQGYKETYYLWYWLVFIRKASIAGVMAFVEHENHRLLGVCMIILVSLCFQGYYHPYVHDGHNLLEIAALALLFVQFYFRIFFFSALTTPTVRNGMSLAIAVFIIIFFLTLFYFFIRYAKKHRDEAEADDQRMQAERELLDQQQVMEKNEDDSSEDDKPIASKISNGAGSGNSGQNGNMEESASRITQSRRGSTKAVTVQDLELMEPSSAGATANQRQDMQRQATKHKIVVHF